MATDSNDNAIPPFLAKSLESSDDVWFHHLVYLFLCVLLFQVARAFGAVNRLHRLLILFCSLLTSSGRQRHAERQRLTKELHDMRTELKTISMTAEFARYSRLERRIKASNRRLAELAPESWGTSFIRVVSINVALFILEGLIIGWLVRRTPSILVSQSMVDAAQGSLLYWLFRLVYHIPVKIVVLLWIALCHYASNPAVAWLSARVFAREPASSMNGGLSERLSAEGPIQSHSE